MKLVRGFDLGPAPAGAAAPGMALLLLLFGGLWAQAVVSQESGPGLTVPHPHEALLNSTKISTVPRVPEESAISWAQTPVPPSLIPFGTSELPFWGTSNDPGTATLVPDPTISQEHSSLLVETSHATSELTVTTEYSTVTDETLTFNPRETFKENGVTMAISASETSGPSVTMAISASETSGPSATMAVSSSDTSGPSVTMAISSSETSGPSVTMAISSSETSGPSVTLAVSSSETSEPSVVTAISSKKTNGLPVTMTTGSLESSSGLPATIATSSVETASVVNDAPVSSIKIAMISTPEPTIITSPRSRGSNGMLLLPVLVTLLAVIVLVALLLLWRRRQKRRTGVLTLSTGGKRNGVVDAWAGPARVPDEETPITAGPGGDKGSRGPETEGSGPQPMLTTFFSRRKSHQGSLVLEELKCGSGTGQNGEEEPLVSNEDDAAEAPTSDGQEAADGAASQRL